MSTTKLTNADFSRLLSENKYTLIPTNENNTKKSKSIKSSNDGNNERQKLKNQKKRERAKKYFAKKKLKEQQFKQKNDEDNEYNEWNKNGKYRDRAKELRDGKNLNNDINVDLKNMGYEWTQYLGGDMNHTHLVKGLDRNLLKQVKDNKLKNDVMDMEELYQKINMKNAKIDNILKETNEEQRDIQFRGQWARNIYDVVFGNKVYSGNGHDSGNGNDGGNNVFKDMYFEFKLDDEREFIPLGIMRSNIANDLNDDIIDNAKYGDCIGYTPKNVRNMIKDVFHKKKSVKKEQKGIKRKRIDMDNDKIKKQEVMDSVKSVKIEDDDMNIFSDVSDDYVCDVNLTKKDKKHRHVKFGDNVEIIHDSKPLRKKRRFTSSPPPNKNSTEANYFSKNMDSNSTNKDVLINDELRVTLKNVQSILKKKDTPTNDSKYINDTTNLSKTNASKQPRFAGIGVIAGFDMNSSTNANTNTTPKRAKATDGNRLKIKELNHNEGIDYSDDDDMDNDRFQKITMTKKSVIKHNSNMNKQINDEWDKIQDLWKKGKGKKLHKK